MTSFLLEVGTEELPARFVDEALQQWRSRLAHSLAELKLDPTNIEFYGTPRRLAVLIQGLPQQQPDQVEEIKGPPAQAAFKDGQPTPAARGFAQKQGVALSDLELRATEKGEFVFVKKVIQGQSVADLLADLVPQWITDLEGKRLMRWGHGDLRFSRPIRWLVVLLDDAVLPVRFSNGAESVYTSDRYSAGHRVLHPEAVQIDHADAYVKTLRAASVEVDPDSRRQIIAQQAQAVAQTVGGRVRINPNLLQEVINLVEFPSAVLGSFDPAFLELPVEVVVTEMESHQRYFPVYKAADPTVLLPYFITIANGDPAKADLIAAGNQRVIRARLSDGKFFFDVDRKDKLEGCLAKLETVTFQADLGSLWAKVARIEAIAGQIADQLQIDAALRQQIERAALLCKADLVTQMVGEFPELQGVMGEHYARHSGEPEAVAVAIREHYLPRGAGDALPQTLVGQVVGMADRLDNLVSIFSLGQLPTGSSDPFALRRAANAVITVAWAANLPLNLQYLLPQIIDAFAKQYQAVMRLDGAALLQQLRDFFLQRLSTLLKEDLGVDYDLVNAVLGEDDPDYQQRALQNLLDGRDRAQFLQLLRQDGRLAEIYPTVNRASRLAAQGSLDTQQLDVRAVVDPALFQKQSERDFFTALSQLTAQADYEQLVSALATIAPTLSRFFDGEDSVLVMDPDAAIQRNRLNLLGILRNHARLLADFGLIVKS
jgi:glycyl-tRNA synthetase beta chain